MRTRAHILEAAASLFAERGAPATSMADVAVRVRMTKGAVYFHFPNKESLIVAVVEAHYERWPVLLDEVRALGLGPMDTLEELLGRTAVLFRDDPVVQGGARLQMEQPVAEGILPEPYTGWIERLTAILDQAQAAGELRPGIVPLEAARALVSAFFGTQHITARLGHRAELVDRWAQVRGLLFQALKA